MDAVVADAAETKIALDGMSPKQRHEKTGMRLQMHLAKILRRATAWAWSSIARMNLCTTSTRPRRDLAFSGHFPQVSLERSGACAGARVSSFAGSPRRAVLRLI